MVSLTIDDRSVTVAADTTILDAAARLGINIPTLCWLQKVSPTGACRVCSVEIEGVDRPMTACNTPVKEGIRVITRSERLDSIRRKMLELMLVNHPLDCPICDAAGECDLQDACYGLNVVRQEYSAMLEKRPIRYDWSLLESDPNRCILCEKCVKVDHEIVGADAIAVVNCGEAAVIDTLDGGPLNCEFCGNCIAACPTGTLISKPFKFRARPWALAVTGSVCPFCPAGCRIEYHTRNNRVERVTSDDGSFNGGNLCINGRFGYSYVNSAERLTTPLIGEGDGQRPADWNSAMEEAVSALRGIVQKHGPDAVAGISSPRLTNEENFLFRKLMKEAIGTCNVDSEARFGYAPARDLLMDRLGLSGASATIDRIDCADAILVIGCDLNAEATGIEYRVIKAATKGDAGLVIANMRDVKLKRFANSHLKYCPGGEVHLLNGLLKAILDIGFEDSALAGTRLTNLDELRGWADSLSPDELAEGSGVAAADLREAARLIAGKKKGIAIVFGADLMRSANPREAMDALVNLALVTGAVGGETGGLFPINDKNNIQGLLDMGVNPDPLQGRHVAGGGKDLWQIIEGIEKGEIKALYAAGCDILSFPDSNRIARAMERLDFLLVQEIFPTGTAARANVVLPAASAAEKEGTFTTIDNRVESLNRAVDPPGNARTDLEIMGELYCRYALTTHAGSQEKLLEEIAGKAPQYQKQLASVGEDSSPIVKEGYRLRPEGYSLVPVAAPAVSPLDESAFRLLCGPILFHSGTTTQWSENNLVVAHEGYIEIFEADAARLAIAEGETIRVSSVAGSITGRTRLTNRLQQGLLFAPSHFRELRANSLLSGNSNMAAVTVEKVNTP